MKRLITILLLAISGFASAQTYQLNYPDIRIGNSNTGKIVLRGSNVQFPFLALGSTTDSVLTIVGGVIKKVPRSQFSGGSSYTFNNGLTNTSGVVTFGGGLLNNTTLDLNGKNLILGNAGTFDNSLLLLSPTGGQLTFNGTTSSAGFIVQDNRASIEYGGFQDFSISTEGFILKDTPFGNPGKGINYRGVDFSNFEDSTLVTKKWVVDNFSGGTSTPDTTIYRTVSNSFSKAQTNTQISNAISAYTPPSQVQNSLSPNSTVLAPSVTAFNERLELKDRTSQLAPQKIITSDGSYNAFPSLSKKNGIIYLVYRKGSDHVSIDGRIVIRKSLDSGKTWSAETIIFQTTGVDYRDPSITTLANGNLIITFFSGDDTPSGFSTYTSISTNNGVTWSTPVLVGGYSVWSAITSPAIQLSNGDLLITTYGHDGSNQVTHVHKSTNGGGSWSVVGTITSVPYVDDFAKVPTEPSIILLPNGNILATVRNEATAKTSISTSTDNGATWSAATDKFPSLSRALMTLSDNKVIFNYRSTDFIGKNGNNSAIRYSPDYGITFTNPEAISIGDDEYSSLVQVLPNTFLYVLASQDISTVTISNIYSRYLSDPASLAVSPTGNFDGINNKNDLYQNGYLWLGKKTGGNDSYIITPEQSEGTGSVVLQAGAGSSTFGGGIRAWANAASSHPGDLTLFTSNNASAKIRFNNGGLGTGSDVGVIDGSGNLIMNGTVNLSIPTSATTGAILVGRGNQIQSRTTAQILSDIGAEVPLTFNNGLSRSTNTITPTYGTGANTIAQGNDSRINNGQTAFSWGNPSGVFLPLTAGSGQSLSGQLYSTINTNTGSLSFSNSLTTGLNSSMFTMTSGMSAASTFRYLNFNNASGNMFYVDGAGNVYSDGKMTASTAPTNPTDVVRKTELDTKQNNITLTTTGTSGAATLVGSTLNIPNYATGGGGGSGTVTSVSVVTANGISGSVANPSTVPAITLSLGNITPTSVTTNLIDNSSGFTQSNSLRLTGSTYTTPSDASIRIENGGSNKIGFGNSAGTIELALPTNSSRKTLTVRDLSGTIALLSDISGGGGSQTLDQVLTTGNTSTQNATVGGLSASNRIAVGGALDVNYVSKFISTTSDNYNAFTSTSGTGEYGIYDNALYFQALTLSNGIRFYGNNTAPNPGLTVNASNNVVIQSSLNLSPLTASALLKLDASKNVVNAVANTDFLPVASPTMTGTPVAPTPGTNINTTQIPTTAWTNTYYAAKASPTFTGTPAAPTATAKTSTTQIATTAFVGKQFTATGSGTGAATTISFAHGVTGVTSANSVIVTPNNAAAAGLIYVTLDATNVNVVYSVAPASGTNNLAYSVSIK